MGYFVYIKFWIIFYLENYIGLTLKKPNFLTLSKN